MRYKLLLFVTLCLLTVTACKDQNRFVLEGEITELNNPSIYLFKILNDSSKINIDTITTQEGRFSYESYSDSIVPVVLSLEENSKWITAWVKNGETIKIKGDANNFELIEIKGNQINDELTLFKQNNKDLIKELKTNADSLRVDEIKQQLITNTENFIKAKPSSVASLVLMQNYLLELCEPEVVEEYLALVESPAKDNPLYDLLKVACERLKQAHIEEDQTAE
ncbi:hypothetical protein M2138_000229 [Dysgonomonadaceae bacterium PH5-43]|nr:hypothetical protein [Dysgonomonadaceae bacterium PH5-43]